MFYKYGLCFPQFIQQAIRKDFTNVEQILDPPEGQDEGVWKYEHLRCVYLFHDFVGATSNIEYAIGHGHQDY